MFDIGAGELIVIGIVALLVIGPHELPTAIRAVGRMVNRMRRMAGEFRTQFDDAMREADLAEAKQSVNSINDALRSANAAANFNPIETIRSEIRNSVDSLKSDIAGPNEPAGTAEAESEAPASAEAPAAGAADEAKPVLNTPASTGHAA